MKPNSIHQNSQHGFLDQRNSTQPVSKCKDNFFFRKNCVIVKSCKWPFVSRLLKVQRGTAGKKKKGIFYAWMIMQESRALKAPQQVLDMRKLFPS